MLGEQQQHRECTLLDHVIEARGLHDGDGGRRDHEQELRVWLSASHYHRPSSLARTRTRNSDDDAAISLAAQLREGPAHRADDFDRRIARGKEEISERLAKAVVTIADQNRL